MPNEVMVYGVAAVVQCYFRMRCRVGLKFVHDVSCGFVMVEKWDQSWDS
jgi:hypothetical protein